MIAALRPNYVPHEQWSASGLSLDQSCRRSYGLRYFEGRKEVALTWAEAEKLPEPPKAPKGASAVEKKRAKEARKAWNKARRPALGKAGHAVIEAYFAQGVPGYWHAPMPWVDLARAFESVPGQVVLPGLAYLPAPRDCLDVLIEDSIALRWEFLPAGLRAVVEADPIRFSGYKDLVPVTSALNYDNSVHVQLFDHKTTYDFAWCKTPEELAKDPQANLYALDVCQRFELEAVECTWVYYRTEGSPAAHPVTFTVRRADAEAVVTELVRQALELRALMRACPKGDDAKRHLFVMQLPANPEACDDFGGRDCHASRGGPCNPQRSYGALMRKQTNRRTTLAARKEGRDLIMLTPEQLARKAELAAKADPTFKDKRAIAAFDKLDAADSDDARAAVLAELAKLGENFEGGAAPTATEPAAAPEKPAEQAPAPAKLETAASAPAPSKPKAPKAATADAATDAPVITFDGVSVEVPKASPLYKAIVKVCNARKAYDAALAGEA